MIYTNKLILKIKDLEHENKKLKNENWIYNEINKMMLLQISPLCDEYEKYCRKNKDLYFELDYSFSNIVKWAAKRIGAKRIYRGCLSFKKNIED